MQASRRRINASSPLSLCCSVVNQPKKPVASLAWDESGSGQFVCATRDQVSVWNVNHPDEAGTSNAQTTDQACSAELRFGHVLEPSEKRTITDVILKSGYIVVVGRSSAAKRKKENKGILSHINPTVFAKIAFTNTQLQGDPSSASMKELDLPISLAQWDAFGGICAAPDSATNPYFDLIAADPEGQIAKLALEPETSRNAHRPLSSCRSEGLDVANCRMLPAVSGQGKLTSLLQPAGRPNLVVGAFSHSVIVWDHHRGVLLTCMLTSSFSPPNTEITGCCCMTTSPSADPDQADHCSSLEGLHLLFAFDASRSRGGRGARGGRSKGGGENPEQQVLSSLLEASQGAETSDAIFLSQLEVCVSQSSQLSHADKDERARVNCHPVDHADTLPSSCVALSLQADGDAHVSRRLTVYQRAKDPSTPSPKKCKVSTAAEASRAAAEEEEEEEEEEKWEAVHVKASGVDCTSKYVASGGANGTVVVWNIATAQQVALLRDREGKAREAGRSVTALAMNASFPAVAVGRADGAVDVWVV